MPNAAGVSVFIPSATWSSTFSYDVDVAGARNAYMEGYGTNRRIRFKLAVLPYSISLVNFANYDSEFNKFSIVYNKI